MIIGSTFTSKFLDWEYLRIKDGEKATTGDFLFEYARLNTMPLHLVVFFACDFAWVWILESGVSTAVPLILQFIISSVSQYDPGLEAMTKSSR